METKKTIVISLGGSLVVPDTVDTAFLSGFKKLIEEKVSTGYRFLIIVGGGKTCRVYQDALANINPETTSRDLDWLGIYSTQFNANLVRLVFKGIAHDQIVGDPYEHVQDLKNQLLVAAGMNPGSSTDLGAILAAEKLGAKTVINLSNVEYVCDSDPRTNPDAKRFETLTWADYRSFIPSEWKPGLSTPFDPIASARAEELGITVAIMNGDLENFANYLDGKPFRGTTIS